ncbi:MAG: hypothetical protein RL719_1169, partial [Actinomycetota bacterium]
MARKTDDLAAAKDNPLKSAAILRARRKMVDDGGTPSLRGTIIKIILLGLADAAALFVSLLLIAQHQWVYFWSVVVVTVILNWIYLRRGGLPAKYLAPGVLFLLCFSFSVVVYSGFIAFTNYGGQHNGSKDDAIASVELGALVTDTNAPWMDVSILEDANKKYFFLASDNMSELAADGVTPVPHYYLGGQDFADQATGWHEITGDELNKVTFGPGMMGYDIATGYEGFKTLSVDEITQQSAKFATIQVPLGADIYKDGFMALDPSAAGVQR